jgi:hypothetical protein
VLHKKLHILTSEAPLFYSLCDVFETNSLYMLLKNIFPGKGARCSSSCFIMPTPDTTKCLRFSCMRESAAQKVDHLSTQLFMDLNDLKSSGASSVRDPFLVISPTHKNSPPLPLIFLLTSVTFL